MIESTTNDDNHAAVDDSNHSTDISHSDGSDESSYLPAAIANIADSRRSIPEDRIVESIYQLLMESMCRDVAVNIHELIKTGADDLIPSSWKLFSGKVVAPTRRELYPELYNEDEDDDGNENENENNKNEDKGITANSKGETTNHEHSSDSLSSKSTKGMTDLQIRAVLEKYAVDLPSMSTSHTVASSTKRRKLDTAEEQEQKRRLLSKIQNDKESNYKDSGDEDDDEDNKTNDDDEDSDDEDFKMEDAEDDNDSDSEDKQKSTKGHSLSSSSSVAPEAPVSSSLGVLPPTTEGAVASQTNINSTTAAVAKSNINSNNCYMTKLDIWGKNPAKEPKNRLCRCQLCGRLISTSRFASHLDKCMGLSTSRTGGGGGQSSSLASSSMSMSSPSMMMTNPMSSMGTTGSKKRNGGAR